MDKRMLPIGIESFTRIRRENYYYVDKTELIKNLLYNCAQVTLFTRPRRFGKSLNMSMLKAFFELGCDASLFDGLSIIKEREICEKYMGQFPVIFLTLKGVDGRNFQTARDLLCAEIGNEAARFSFLQNSNKLDTWEKENYRRLLWGDGEKRLSSSMSDEALQNSLRTLSRLLARHFGRNVILLIDEYDVPLDKAYQNGYYDEMTGLIRGILSQALKTNESLQFAVLTGCLRIAKDSIFTGLNNLRVLTIMDRFLDECFGFSDREVRDMLDYYGQTAAYDTVKEWYDGYRFGETEVYCPWDVVNYCADLRIDAKAQAKDYWSNTSGNGIVRTLLSKASAAVKRDLETLIAGGSIRKAIRPDLTYRDLDGSADNLWSVLFMTGYLTVTGLGEGGMVDLVIPNKEIRGIFTSQIWEWFTEMAAGETDKRALLREALLEGNAPLVEEQLNGWLRRTISIRDAGTRAEKKESFYHGVLLGLLSQEPGWYVVSNAEAGEGFCDIRIEDMEQSAGMILELKYAEEGAMDAACQRALKQIEERRYADTFVDDGMETVLRYGIAFYKKRCRVMLG